MGYLVLLGRVLYSAIFILASFGHFTPEVIAYATAKGVPMADLLVPLSGILSLLGGVSIFIGYKARWGAWLLIVFLIPVTFMMHAFWMMTDPNEAAMEQSMFFKNLSLIGAALLIAYFGAGPVSVDERTIKKFP